MSVILQEAIDVTAGPSTLASERSGTGTAGFELLERLDGSVVDRVVHTVPLAVDEAQAIADSMKDDYTSTEHLLMAMAQPKAPRNVRVRRGELAPAVECSPIRSARNKKATAWLVKVLVAGTLIS